MSEVTVEVRGYKEGSCQREESLWAMNVEKSVRIC